MGYSRTDREVKNVEDRETERAESTLMASVFSASKSPRTILLSISSIIVALLRPLTNTLYLVSRDSQPRYIGGEGMRGNIHISQSYETAAYRVSFQPTSLNVKSL